MRLGNERDESGRQCFTACGVFVDLLDVFQLEHLS
jgi:hypothetical protein